MNIFTRKQDSDLLKYLDDTEANAVIALATEREIPDEEALFASGSRKRELYEIVYGSVALWETSHTGRRIDIDTCEAGEIIGEVAYAIPAAQPYHASAVGTVRVRVYSTTVLGHFLREHPVIGAKIGAALNDSLCRRHVRVTQKQTG
jgi:CRP-like cAMP-binding protein